MLSALGWRVFMSIHRAAILPCIVGHHVRYASASTIGEHRFNVTAEPTQAAHGTLDSNIRHHVVAHPLPLRTWHGEWFGLRRSITHAT